jgi:hypothetical protein
MATTLECPRCHEQVEIDRGPPTIVVEPEDTADPERVEIYDGDVVIHRCPQFETR